MPKFDAKRKLMPFVDGIDWDSMLWVHERDDGGNITVKMKIRVCFLSINIKTGPNSGYYQEEDDRFGTAGWDHLLWEQWKREYCSVIDDYWSHRFWLIPPDDYEDLNYGSFKPNIVCGLKIEPVQTQGGAHYIFNVIRVADYRVNRYLAGGDGYTGWRADTGLGADPQNDVRIVNMKTVGHLFALPHHGRENANHNRYFRLPAPITGSGDVTAVESTLIDRTFMPGLSHGRELFHARPWQTAMQRHTGKNADSWKVVTQRLHARSS